MMWGQWCKQFLSFGKASVLLTSQACSVTQYGGVNTRQLAVDINAACGSMHWQLTSSNVFMSYTQQVMWYEASQVPFNRSLLLGLVAHVFSQSDALTVTGSCICGHRSGGICSLLGLGTFGNLAPV